MALSVAQLRGFGKAAWWRFCFRDCEEMRLRGSLEAPVRIGRSEADLTVRLYGMITGN